MAASQRFFRVHRTYDGTTLSSVLHSSEKISDIDKGPLANRALNGTIEDSSWLNDELTGRNETLSNHKQVSELILLDSSLLHWVLDQFR